MKTSTYKTASQNAFSLLGVMISLVINVIVFCGLLHYMFILVKSYNSMQHRFEQQHAQFIAQHYLALDIRNAGYHGCNSSNLVVSHCNTSNSACTDRLPQSIQKLIQIQDIKPASEILILYNVTENFGFLTKDMTMLADPLEVDLDAIPKIDDQMQIDDCLHSESFVISNGDQNLLRHEWPENVSRELSKLYQRGSVVYRPAIIAYYLRKSAHTSNNFDQNYSLYRDDWQRNSVALIDSLNDMQIDITIKNHNQPTVFIKLLFKDFPPMEFIFVPRNFNPLQL